MGVLSRLVIQTSGESRKRSGKISRRPNSMSAESTNFEKSEKALKFPVGPTMPRPGPMLLKVQMTAEKVVSKPLPSRDTRTSETIRMQR